MYMYVVCTVMHVTSSFHLFLCILNGAILVARHGPW